ncbi:MAG: Tol-Pal system beta propeller repeat protein TolB [Thermodesulfobacteriota bacterium]
MKKYFPLPFFLLLWMIVPLAEARVYLDITAPTFVQIPIVLPKWEGVNTTPPGLPTKVHEILANDLTLSGFFKVIHFNLLPYPLKEKTGIPPNGPLTEWASTGGEILLAGEVAWKPGDQDVRLKFHLFDLVEQKPLFRKQYEGPTHALRKMVHRIADEVVLQLTGEKGVHNTKIAFVGTQGAGKEIFVSDFDGAEVKQMTRNQSINLFPAWSPDGKRIAFTSYLRRNPDLYLIDANGQNLQRLTSYSGLNAAATWSPEGKRMALMMGLEGKSDIYVIDANGDNPKRLTTGHGNEASPTWSPDGKQIAFVSDRSGTPQIYIMGADGSNVRRLTFEGSYNTQPSWSPKGDRIAFCGRVEGRHEIFTIGIDGFGLRRLTSNSGSNESPCWSPDGRYLAFSSNRLGGSKIFVMNANGLNQRPLTSGKGGEWSPAWSCRLE